MIKLILKAKVIMSEEEMEAIRIKITKDFEFGVAVIPNEFDVLIVKDYGSEYETDITL